MISIFTLLLLFVPIASLQPKLCINCKYFITDNNMGKLGTCLLFPKERNEGLYDLVTGVDVEYMYCYSTRAEEDLCGKKGKMFKKKRAIKNTITTPD